MSPGRHPWLRRAAWTLGSLLALPLALAAIALAALRTPWGGDLALKWAIPMVNGMVEGTVEVEGLRLYGDTLLLRQVALRAPDGGVVARVPLVRVELDVPALLAGKVSLDRVDLLAPRLALRSGPEGPNLSRALAPEEKPAEARSIVVDRLSVVAGRLTFARAGGGASPLAEVEELSLVGALRLPAGDATPRIVIGGDGHLAAPTQGPVALAARLLDEDGDGTLEGTLRLEAGDSGLRVQGEGRGPDRFEVSIPEGRLSRRLAEALLPPRAAPASAITLEGRVSRREGELSAELTLTAGRASAEVEGALDLDRRATPGLEVTVRNLDPSLFAPSAPSGDLDLRLTAEGAAPSLEQARGTARLVVRASTLAGQPVGPLRIEADASGKGIDLRVPEGRLPGMALTGGVRVGGAGDLGGRLEAEVQDAAATAAWVEGLAGADLPRVAGRGRVTIAPAGTLDRPGVEARADVPRLVVGDREIRQLDLRFDLGPERLEGRLSAERPSVALDLAGARLTDPPGLRLEQLRLSYPSATWQLSEAARVRLGPEPRVQGLALVAGEQRLTVSASGGATPAVDVAVDDLRLEALPDAALPPDLSPRGRVDAQLEARLTDEGPQGTASLRLVDGRIAEVSGVEATATARLGPDRIEGELQAALLGGRVWADWGLPWPPPVAEGLYLAVRARALALGRLLAVARARSAQPVAESITSLSGRLDAEVKLWGAWAHPRSRGRVEVREGWLALRGGPGPYRLRLRADGTLRRIRLETLRVEAGEGWARLEGTAVRAGGAAGAPAFDLSLAGRAEHLPVPGDPPRRLSARLGVDGRASPRSADLALEVTDLALVPPEDAAAQAPSPARRLPGAGGSAAGGSDGGAARPGAQEDTRFRPPDLAW